MTEVITSPCIAKCFLKKNVCTGCLRTREELRDWRSKPVQDRMALMNELKGQTSTHACPKCQGPAYCAMEAGKSASACWCMGVTIDPEAKAPEATDQCLCRRCLVDQ